jgi:hypothetical protein
MHLTDFLSKIKFNNSKENDNLLMTVTLGAIPERSSAVRYPIIDSSILLSVFTYSWQVLLDRSKGKTTRPQHCKTVLLAMSLKLFVSLLDSYHHFGLVLDS